MRRVSWLRGITAAATTAALFLPAWNADAQSRVGDGARLSARVVSAARPSVDGFRADRPRTDEACSPGPNLYNRTRLCTVRRASVTLLRNRTPVGTVSFTITQALHLQVKRRDFTERITLGDVRVIGAAGGVRLTLGVSCGNPCTAVLRFPEGRVLASGTRGSIAYHDAIGHRKIHSTASRYRFVFTKAGYAPGEFSYRSLSYRCDDTLRKTPGRPGGQGAGCVFPSFTPTMTSMALLPDIAASIRRIQNDGPGHYGRYGSGHPLHKLTDSKRAGRNRRAVCPRKPPPGRQGTCDEYPFATTYEGGTTLGPNDRGIAWVPAAEQKSQGGLIKTFTYANRVLDKDAFWVQV